MGAHLRNGKNISVKQQAAAAREQQLRQRSAPTGEQQYSSTGLEASSTAGEQQLYRHPSSREQHIPGEFFSPNRPERSPSVNRNAPGHKLPGDQTGTVVYPPLPSSQGTTPRAGEEYTLSPAALERLLPS
ncbi:hypothetical protein PCANC_21412 [Puccinia coronata f. sp. avenae]|uniref:Uncharacterized protein n=1 Tax=Puccinia coronata f. sp. avenae TaxID=200324 RepID=A0A2N5UTC7_9BASI|nr:hypothetical protein PCANC_21412 [Puccinia coronata f. sp. avenae]